MTRPTLFPLLILLLLAIRVPGPAFGDGPEYVCPPCGCTMHDRTFTAAGTCPDCGMQLVRADSMKNVAILVHPGVELLDFAGPGEVFAASGRCRVYTVGPSKDPILSQGFVKVTPEYAFDEAPRPDILVVCGGGTSSVTGNPKLMAWIRDVAADADHMLSVCTGAFVYAEAGLLDGKQATTHWGAVEHLATSHPEVDVKTGRRFVDNGQVITAAGVSAGIDMSLHVLARMYGKDAAVRTARHMEYEWEPAEEYAEP